MNELRKLISLWKLIPLYTTSYLYLVKDALVFFLVIIPTLVFCDTFLAWAFNVSALSLELQIF